MLAFVGTTLVLLHRPAEAVAPPKTPLVRAHSTSAPGDGPPAGSESGHAAPTTVRKPVPPSTTTTVASRHGLVVRPPEPWPAGCCAPLTGLGYDDPALAHMTTHSVKVDNSTPAPPHTNLQRADLVYELRVEDVSRFIALYHSRLPDIVGPIRSARTSDPPLLSPLGHPIVSFSGGNPAIRKIFHELPWLLDANGMVKGGYYFRSFEDDRVVPHNLYVRAARLRSDYYRYGGPPPEQFHIVRSGEVNPPGTAVGRVRLQVGNVPSAFWWDPATQYWRREEYGKPHTDVTGEQIGRRNVLLLAVNYGRSGVDSRSPEAITTGTGEAWFLIRGEMIEGMWSRPTPESTWTLTTRDGVPVGLAPGPTWVDLIDIAPRFEAAGPNGGGAPLDESSEG